MSKKLYVYSTLAASVAYTEHAPMGEGNDMPREIARVHIKGGAGVADAHLVTPRGVVTEITEEQAALLRRNSVFKIHEKNGHVEISGTSVDPGRAAADMNKDASAPATGDDMPASEQPTMGNVDEPQSTDGSTVKRKG